MRALAVTSAKRSTTFTDLPTIAESGLPGLAGFDLNSWYGVFAPAKTPATILRIINRDLLAVVHSPDMKEKLAADAAEPAPRHTPEEFQKAIAREIELWDKFLRTSGIRVE